MRTVEALRAMSAAVLGPRRARVSRNSQRLPRRWRALPDASDVGYLATISSSVRRAPALSPSSVRQLAMLSIASGTFWLSGYIAISWRCVAIAVRKSLSAYCALPAQYSAEGASGLREFARANAWKLAAAAA